MKDHVTGHSTAFRGAKVILPGEIVETDVTIADGVIAAIGDHGSADVEVDARGQYLAPALIDLHGDAFERQIMPRPGVFFPLEAAVLETDRQLAANGIATAYHAVTLSWEPGLRAIGRARELMAALATHGPRLSVENRVQLRWEIFALDAVDLIEDALAGPLDCSVAFNDHTTMGMRDFDTPVQKRLFELNPDFKCAAFDDPRLRERHAGHARRSDIDVDDYMDLMEKVWARRPEVEGAIRRVAGAARAQGVPMLSHDDTQLETRAFYRGVGAATAEFPMVLHVAEAARAAGDTIVFGAPNAVRGGSHIGSLAAADMVEAGLCDALASDYYYPAMLAGIARMDSEKRASREVLWSLVSTGPARAAGLSDRGSIAPGKRADLVLVDWPDNAMPAIRGTYVAGRIAYRAMPRGA